MNFKQLLILITILCSLLPAIPLEAGEYYTLEEYIILHPGEKLLEESFNKLVKKNIVERLDKQFSPKIAVVCPGKQISDYWRRSCRSLESRIKQYGIIPRIHRFFIKPTAPLGKQSAVFHKALETNPDYLIFTLDASRHQRMIESILVAGKPKVILQNITTPLKIWEGKQPFMYVGFDHAQGTQMLAKYFARKTGGHGKYAVFLPDPGHLNKERGGTFISYMDKYTSLKLAAVFRTGIDKEKARLAALKIAEHHPDIKFIYACSTDIALGAIEGLREKGLLNRIMVNGWGGGSPEIDAIKKGELEVTVMRINDDNGVAMADAIILDMLGKNSQIPLVFSGRFEILDKRVNAKRLQRLQQESFRYSGN
ncbi:substrate-binding domain-containing protein [Desulfovibrio sp. JC022]|uniref:substrate-binding domain-containing protein n=1 Tax=Desulfovibrio sp. JC022 TaxID=2593642 RepID=UPI001EF21964|nr:substrate-binding domain-containing protein [Desulfovibrio sp. JC022]